MKACDRIVQAVYDAGKLAAAANFTKHRASCAPHLKKEDVFTMKKSTLIAIVAFLSAVTGALAAAFVYLRRREAELDEYEQLLFSEDFSHDEPEEAPEEPEDAPEEV